MKSQVKTLSLYMLCALLIITSVSYGFFLFTSRIFINTAYDNMRGMASRISLQLDYQVAHMDFALQTLMSNRQFMDAVSRSSRAFSQDLDTQITIINSIYKDAFIRNFYRINYFNHNHDFFTSRIITRDTVAVGNNDILDAMPWLPYVDLELPRPLITPSHYDPWLISGQVPVFSILRALTNHGVNVGYLEVQMTIAQLEDVLMVEENGNINLIVTNRNNEIIYHNLNDNNFIPTYLAHMQSAMGDIIVVQNEVSGVTEMLSAYYRPSGINVMLIKDRDVLLAPFGQVGVMTFLVTLVLLLAAFVYGYFYSKRLARGERLQIQSNFNSLQAQINPHFIYNTLNVISSRGLSLGDESIGEICDDIASMLRYSVSTEEKTSAMAEEIDHVRHYLNLQKKRYEHRLNYSVDVSEELMDLQVPKLILQPFVENSIEHGYKHGVRDMNISISGKKLASQWILTISDDGCGFEEEALLKLRESISNVDKSTQQLELSLGKLGIINTYVRLRLFFKDLHISFGNNLSAGAFVKLEGRIIDV